jgi:uncharacterized protein (UPF0332 family)
MKYWQESQDDVREVKPDREMAKSILKMIEARIKALETKDRKEFASLVVEDYYEIVKEAITALMITNGYKTLSHEVLIGYLKEFFPQFPESEIRFIDNLRQIRNKIAYKGFFVSPDFLERNETRMKEIVSRLKQILEENLIERT